MSLILDGNAGVTFPNSTVQASAGSVIQVVYGQNNSSFTTTSNSFVAITNLTASITPKFSTSKIMVLISAPINSSAGSGDPCLTLYRNGSNLFGLEGFSEMYLGGSGSSLWGQASLTYVDSPASTSSQTYAVYGKVSGGATLRVGDTGTGDYGGGIALLEIAA